MHVKSTFIDTEVLLKKTIDWNFGINTKQILQENKFQENKVSKIIK